MPSSPAHPRAPSLRFAPPPFALALVSHIILRHPHAHCRGDRPRFPVPSVDRWCCHTLTLARVVVVVPSLHPRSRCVVVPHPHPRSRCVLRHTLPSLPLCRCATPSPALALLFRTTPSPSLATPLPSLALCCATPSPSLALLSLPHAPYPLRLLVVVVPPPPLACVKRCCCRATPSPHLR